MSGTDPFAVLGLTRSASLDEVRVARRRLAFEVHPDRGGDAAAMQQLNAAFDACVAHLTGRRPLDAGSPTPDAARTAARETPRQARQVQWGRQRGRLDRDEPSFTVDALPAETFEALLVVASWIGEVLDDDPPYVLECHLVEPEPCWCRLEVMPDAGASTVSLMAAPMSPEAIGFDVDFAERVRDVWVEHLNQLGRPTP